MYVLEKIDEDLSDAAQHGILSYVATKTESHACTTYTICKFQRSVASFRTCTYAALQALRGGHIVLQLSISSGVIEPVA